MGNSEDEEEEYLVHVEFESLLERETFKDPNLFFKVIGIETEKPVMQIGDQVFMGTYCDIPGTSLFFEEVDKTIDGDAVFSKTLGKTLQYKHKTRKSLIMRRVFIKKKALNTGDNEETEQEMTKDESNQINLIQLADKSRSDCVVQSELGMEIADATDKFKMKTAANNLKNTGVDLNTNEKCTNSQGSISSKKFQDDIEPVAGPSWAPDISLGCKDVMSITVNTDEMSRLIAEQMTLESDISEQNSIQCDPKT